MIGTYPTSSYPHFDNHQPPPPPGVYMNNHPRSMIGKVRPTNGTSPMLLRYPSPQPPYGHQMIKPRMMTYGTPSQVIMPQQIPIMYDPNTIYRVNGQQAHHLPPDANILKSLLQTNPQMVSKDDLHVLMNIVRFRILKLR